MQAGYKWGPGGWYDPRWSTVYKPVFIDTPAELKPYGKRQDSSKEQQEASAAAAEQDEAAEGESEDSEPRRKLRKARKTRREALRVVDDIDEVEPSGSVFYHTRSQVRKEQQADHHGASETMVVGAEDEDLHHGSCLPDYDRHGAEKKKRKACGPEVDNVIQPSKGRCLPDRVDVPVEEEDPFPDKLKPTSCGWSTQRQLPGLEEESEEEEVRPASSALSEGTDEEEGGEPEQAQREADEHEDNETISRNSVDRGTLIDNAVFGKTRTGSATKMDPHHAFPDLVDNFVGNAQKFNVPTKGVGGHIVRHSELYQIEGSLNGRDGIFEWIIDRDKVTHRRFISKGRITGYPNQIPQKE